jgi:hypothetical protein
MEDDQKNNGGEFQTKEKGLVPPLVTTKFTAQDFGNATPRDRFYKTPNFGRQCFGTNLHTKTTYLNLSGVLWTIILNKAL